MDEAEVSLFWQTFGKIVAKDIGYFQKTVSHTHLKYQSVGNRLIVCG